MGTLLPPVVPAAATEAPLCVAFLPASPLTGFGPLGPSSPPNSADSHRQPPSPPGAPHPTARSSERSLPGFLLLNPLRLTLPLDQEAFLSSFYREETGPEPAGKGSEPGSGKAEV